MAFILLQASAPWIAFKEQDSVVFYSLIGISLLVVVTVFEKYLVLNRARKTAKEYAPKMAQAFLDNNWEILTMNITNAYSKHTHLARIVRAGLKERNRLKEKQLSESAIVKHMNQAMEREIINRQNYYRRGLGFLDAIGSTAPFIGALGGTAPTFALGTILAIPTIWFATYFRNKVLLLEGDMKFVASELISYVEENATQ